MRGAIEAPPIVDYIARDAGGQPYLVGSRCGRCGHLYVGRREACAKCYSRDGMEPRRLAEEGAVYSWTIVARSFPGVETPFVDVIVDLADGAHIKGLLRGVTPNPDAILFDLPVRVVFAEAVPPGQDQVYLAFHFVPAMPAQ